MSRSVKVTAEVSDRKETDPEDGSYLHRKKEIWEVNWDGV